MAESKPREVKVVLLGDTGVGKSSLVLRFVTNNFKPYSESTIGASFMSKLMTVNGKPIKFQIWDTAGQEKYHSLAPMYYRGAAAAILVYDITRSSTFKTLQNWVEELKSKGPKDIAIAIAGNKADLEDSREVERSVAQNYANDINAIYLETSAKEDTNVQDIFVKLSARLPAPQAGDPNVVRASNNNIRAGNKPAAKGGCC
jgi:small GTP-binding protein